MGWSLGGERYNWCVVIQVGNGRRVIDFCAERALCISNMYFKHKNIHVYTLEWNLRRKKDLVLINMDMMKHLHDTKTVRELERNISYHSAVLFK